MAKLNNSRCYIKSSASSLSVILQKSHESEGAMSDYKKWKFTNNEMEIDGHPVREIEACIEFSVAGIVVKKGQKGGWLEKPENLSQHRNCWVFQNCFVLDNAHVKDNAILRYGSIARNNALIYGDAIITESLVSGNGKVGDFATVTNAAIYDNAEIEGHASLTGEGIFHALEHHRPQEGDTYIAEFARLDEYAQVYDGPAIYGFAIVRGNSKIFGPVKIHGEAIIESDVKFFDHAEVCGNAFINSQIDQLTE